MAKGWESKSVEEQISSSNERQGDERRGDERRGDGKLLAQGEAARKREIQALELQKERILSERTSSPVRRAALQAALAEIESKLEKLG